MNRAFVPRAISAQGHVIYVNDNAVGVRADGPIWLLHEGDPIRHGGKAARVNWTGAVSIRGTPADSVQLANCEPGNSGVHVRKPGFCRLSIKMR